MQNAKRRAPVPLATDVDPSTVENYSHDVGQKANTCSINARVQIDERDSGL